MIQRIQSIYLLLTVALGVALYILPLASLPLPSEAVVTAGPEMLKITIMGFDSPATPEPLPFLPLQALTGVGILSSLIALFTYKKRPIQMRFCAFGIIFQVLTGAMIVLYLWMIQKDMNTVASYSVALVFPLIQAVLLYLAYKAILRDEKLVKSIDRIR